MILYFKVIIIHNQLNLHLKSIMNIFYIRVFQRIYIIAQMKIWLQNPRMTTGVKQIKVNIYTLKLYLYYIYHIMSI